MPQALRTPFGGVLQLQRRLQRARGRHALLGHEADGVTNSGERSGRATRPGMWRTVATMAPGSTVVMPSAPCATAITRVSTELVSMAGCTAMPTAAKASSITVRLCMSG